MENTTVIQSNLSCGIYIVVTLYLFSVVISTLICAIIMYLTYVTPNLHTPTNLLLSNTCLCNLIFSSVSTMNIFYFFIESKTSDWSCRIRGYLTYVSICLVTYSLVIQAIARSFGTVFYKHRYLLTMKYHFYLIIFQTLFSILSPLSSLITTHIVYRPFKLCLVPIQYPSHALIIIIIIYFIPLISIIILYIIIYCYTKNSSLNNRRLLHRGKRDRILARNILILLSIILFGGIPLFIYVMLSSKIGLLPTNFYLCAIAAPGIAIIFEKITIIILNKEIRNVIKQRIITFYNRWFLTTTPVLPISTTNNTNMKISRITNKINPIRNVQNSSK